MDINLNKFTLRPWQRADAASLAQHINNKKVWDNVRDYIPYPYSQQDAMDFFARTEATDNIEFAIVIDGKAVGGVGVEPQEDIERLSAEIGYWLSEDYWGQGIMTEAIKAVVDHIFTNTELIRLFAAVYDHNPASMHILEKSGFSKVGVMHSAAIKNNQIIDMHLYELIKK